MTDIPRCPRVGCGGQLLPDRECGPFGVGAWQLTCHLCGRTSEPALVEEPSPTPRLVIPIGGCQFRVWSNEYVETVMPDQTVCAGEAHVDPARYSAEQIAAYAATARERGYQDAGALNRWHEFLHTVLAVGRGLAWSPTLFAVAHGEPMPAETQAEEAALEAFERAMNGVADRL